MKNSIPNLCALLLTEFCHTYQQYVASTCLFNVNVFVTSPTFSFILLFSGVMHRQFTQTEWVACCKKKEHQVRSTMQHNAKCLTHSRSLFLLNSRLSAITIQINTENKTCCKAAVRVLFNRLVYQCSQSA